MAVEERLVEVGPLKWFCREANPMNSTDKPPVLLLHSFPSQSYSWRQVLPALAEQGFRAIAPDWPGFGFSAKPDKRDFAYTPDAFVGALADLLQALEVERFSLVVQGFLGAVGLRYALQNPDQIERLAIFNTPLSTTAKLPWKIQQMGLPLVGDMMTQDPLLVDRLLEGGGPYQVADKDLDVYRRPFLKSSDAGRSLLYTLRNLQLPTATAEIEPGFANWERPILVAWGMSDPWLPFSMAENFTKAVPDAELVKLEEVGHYAQEDWYEKVNEVLLPFLRRQSH
ncbi:alpha/beta fold hydrolase [Trichocoleus desertorum]|uniref:Alpha/beta fold hydrolase n=1 Tax=Trichocoleus desertorum GB2-A4 TaxID=2933944 RepID=A0ABV0J9Z8_9CYAN